MLPAFLVPLLDRLALGQAVARVKSLATGPVVVSIAIATVVVTLAICAAWLRSDARRDAAIACDLREHKRQIAAALTRETALMRAGNEKDIELLRRAKQARDAESEQQRISAEMEALREKSKLEAAGRGCVPADDEWLRGRSKAR